MIFLRTQREALALSEAIRAAALQMDWSQDNEICIKTPAELDGQTWLLDDERGFRVRFDSFDANLVFECRGREL